MADFGGHVAEACRPEVEEILPEIWEVAEAMGKQVVEWVQPTNSAEEKRHNTIEYLQKVFRNSIGVEFFPYGSVPLKTYLPDGDIDLTAITSLPPPEALPHKVFAVIQGLENNPNADYLIKDTKFIDAQVKLVKCVVDNIAFDLSFNQLGGISTLCFLEEVDHYIGKNHLFKRSILLVKAWCLYESHILGSHQGLMSTYAMETLVLYIFQLFHGSLEGPLAVLYKFLAYFDKFNWESYYISLNGPVSKSSLPDVVDDMAHNVQNGYLLSEKFLRNRIDKFRVPITDAESQIFSPKHLNIIDPLKANNNLGRSVSIGNFYRIQRAFRYGAQNLGRVFTLPRERIPDALKNFFANTFEKHGHKRIGFTRPFYPKSSTGGFFSSDIIYTPVASCTSGYPMGDMRSSLSLPAGEMYSTDQFYHPTPAWYTREYHVQPYNNNYSCSSYYGSSFTTLDGSSMEGFSDLTGNYEINIRSLVYGQHCHGHPLCIDRMANPFNSFGSHFPWTQFNVGPYFEEDYIKSPGVETYILKGYTSRGMGSSRRRRSHRRGSYQHQGSVLESQISQVELRSHTNLSDGTSIALSETFSGWGSVSSQVNSAEPLSGSHFERFEKQPYSHKDEDFPPLTGKLPRDLKMFR